jgi:hypothetical protein
MGHARLISYLSLSLPPSPHICLTEVNHTRPYTHTHRLPSQPLQGKNRYLEASIPTVPPAPSETVVNLDRSIQTSFSSSVPLSSLHKTTTHHFPLLTELLKPQTNLMHSFSRHNCLPPSSPTPHLLSPDRHHAPSSVPELSCIGKP